MTERNESVLEHLRRRGQPAPSVRLAGASEAAAPADERGRSGRFEILGELKARKDVRAIIWRAEGKSFSSGRDVAAIGGGQVSLTHHELMSRGHAGIIQILDIQAPIIVAMKGWTIGASFQRALICDIRIAAEGSRMMLPEVTHGVIPDTGGVGRLFQICGHGVAAFESQILVGECGVTQPVTEHESRHVILQRVPTVSDLRAFIVANGHRRSPGRAEPGKLGHADLVPMDDPALYADWPKTAVPREELARLIRAALDRLVRTADFSAA